MSRQLNSRTLAPRADDRSGRGGTVSFAVVLALALFAVLFPWFPGGLHLEAGTTAPQDILAPRAVDYESSVLTARAREERAAAVAEQPFLDPEIRSRQLSELDAILLEISSIRDDEDLSASARETAVRAIPGIAISARSSVTVTEADGASWRALIEEARTVLGRTLADAIPADGVALAQRDAAARLSPRLSADQVLAVGELIDPLIVPTLSINEERTEQLRQEQRDSTEVVYQAFSRGEIVVGVGSELSEEHIEALDELGVRPRRLDLRQIVPVAIVAALAGAALSLYLTVIRPPAVRGPRRVILLGLLLVLPVASAKFALPFISPDFDRQFLVHALPLAAGPIAVALLLDATSAIVIAAVLAAVMAFTIGYLPGLDPGGAAAELETARLSVATFAGSLGGIYSAARADRLQRFVVLGFSAATATLLALLPFWLIDPAARPIDLVWIVGSITVGALLISLISVGSFVLLSRPFGIITRVELMELTQLSQPLLRRLQDEAPGTFQHSILVGNLAERAADRIGADPLLARVGAYYHDIGKLSAPSFFIENTGSGENPHAGLDPLQSTRVILQHVSGGVELGRRARLPEVLIQFIEQHHGTRLVAFFYRNAAELKPDIDPDLFRYPGPKPQSREAVLVMLADSCEAATRASSDRSPERITETVDTIFRERIDEREFDESPISLRDLELVRQAYISTLTAVFHPRVEYPRPTPAELEARGRTAVPADPSAVESDAEGADSENDRS